MYELTTLSFITTYRCTAACDHCCFNCSPARNEIINCNNLLKYIQDAAQISSVRVIVFTGGECFLLGDKLAEAVQCASELGLITRCVTNGYWGATENSTRKRLHKLRSVGLTEINFSVGDNHAKYVPVEYVERAARLACELGITTVINIELFSDSKFAEEYKRRFDKLLNKFNNLIVQFSMWIPNGGETVIKHEKRYSLLANPDEHAGCDAILSTVSITPDEKLAACCGLYLLHLPEMIVGDLKKESLPPMIERLPNDFMKIWLAVDGPERIAQCANEFNKKIIIKQKYVHPCQICVMLYQRREWREAIYKAALKHFERVYDRYLTINTFAQCLNSQKRPQV